MGKSASTKKLEGLLRGVSEEAPERLEPLFDRHGVDEGDTIEALVEEICLDGANTIASLFRGWEGAPYAEIVQDVAKTLKVSVTKKDNYISIERKLLDHLFEKHYEKPEERAKLLTLAREHGVEQTLWTGGGVGLTVLMTTIGQEAVKQVVKQALRSIAGASAARIATFAVPILGAAVGAWTVADLAGPAFRKTVPTVIDVAILRIEFGPKA
jgi:uncharacterized protein YaaW (UPF0174 family)